jgi:two-component system OmpR family response regulator
LFENVKECQQSRLAAPGWNFPRRSRQYALIAMQDRKHVLIVDEDAQARGRLASHLEQQGLRVTAASNGSGMQRALERARIDVVVLDVRPGDQEGLKLCRNLRVTTDVPVILLARRADENERILALEMGADDFLVKTISPRELLARIRNLVRRASGAAASTTPRGRLYRFGGWQLDVVARELSDPLGRLMPLRNSEYRVLSSLLAHGNRVMSRLKLIELMRGRDAAPFDRSIDVRISRLRQVVGDDARVPRIIKTVHGEGYVIGVLVERT